MIPGDGLPALEVSRLNVFYGKSQVVFDLDLSVAKGEVVALLGRNGAGKTSTLLGISGVATATSDALRIDGTDVAHYRPFKRVRAGVSLVPSGSRAFPNLTVHENLTMVHGGSNHHGWSIENSPPKVRFPIVTFGVVMSTLAEGSQA